MFGIRNIDSGHHSSLGFGLRDEGLFREVLGQDKLFRFHNQKKKRAVEKLVMKTRGTRWRRKKRNDIPSLKVS